MNRYKFSITILLTFILCLFAALFFAGCDFIQYVEKPENEVISEEIKLLQEKYVDKIYNVTSKIVYRENEQKIYEYALQDAVNELYECRSEADLNQVYDKHLVIIGKIKTDKEYSDEEEANAVSVYRVAILKQAEESYDKQKYTEDQIIYFDMVFATFSGELFEIFIREDMNGLLQKFYFDVHKEDEILSLISYKDISEYELSQKEILQDTLDKCIADIRNCARKEEIDEIKKVYVFEVYRRDTVRKLNEYIDLQLYRDEQVTEIKSILKQHLELAEEAETTIQEDNIFREYQIAVYGIPTDEMLYTEELEVLKTELDISLANSYKLSFYRENEGIEVQKLLESFKSLSQSIKKKEDVLSQYVVIKGRLDGVKTAKELDAEDRVNLIEELYVQLKDEIEKNIEEIDQAKFFEKAELTYSAMYDRVSLDGVREEYRALAQEIAFAHGAAIDLLKEELREYNSSIFYREAELNEVNALKEEYLIKLKNDLGMDGAKALLQEAKDEIDTIKTNDDLWGDSLTEFRDNLKTLYGDAILEEPRSLTEANDYYELADIIDYYAFYQLSGTEFVCDTFRVKINFDHNDAVWERNEVYWYCELLKSAVDIKTEFELNSDNLVCTLIPYNFATISNSEKTDKIVRQKSLVEFGSDKSGFIDRLENFDDFPYYKYRNKVTVWNSQQLWYALEHEYVPQCIKGSSAESVLNRTKQVLRGIIKEGMSDEEKIFNIYKWFIYNVQYDNLHESYNKSSDPDNLPNQVISAVQSHFIEGAIYDGLSICIGYAKTCLLMLRIEGIEAQFNLARMPWVGDKNTIATIVNGFHGYVLIKLNERWYRCDSQHIWVYGKEGVPSFVSLLMPGSTYLNLYEVAYRNLDWGTDLNFYEKLTYCSKKLLVHSKKELYDLLDVFFENDELSDISVFNSSDYTECRVDLLNYRSIHQKNFDVGEMTATNIKEWIIHY